MMLLFVNVSCKYLSCVLPLVRERLHRVHGPWLCAGQQTDWLERGITSSHEMFSFFVESGSVSDSCIQLLG